MVNKDKTGTERQARRRAREKAWLAENGFVSWESVHTALLSGKARLTPHAPDKSGDSVAQAEPAKSSNPPVESAPL